MQKIARARRAELEKLGEERIFALYVELGSVRRVTESLFKPTREDAREWGRLDFYAWLRAEPGRWERWIEAKRDRAHVEADLVSEHADEVNAENASAMRVKISARQWRAERLSRADYGTLPATVNVGVAVQVGESWLAALRVVKQKALTGGEG